MAKLKTQKNKASVSEYVSKIKNEQQRKDCKQLLKIFKEATSKRPAMWGASIIGYGSYHYKSDRSTQEGDWPLTGFAPRATNISIYIMPGFKDYKENLKKLGKHKVSGGSCLYIKKLEDIDTNILKKIIKDSVKVMQKRYSTK